MARRRSAGSGSALSMTISRLTRTAGASPVTRCRSDASSARAACASSRIENYLGFPTGVSGDELARRLNMPHGSIGPTRARCLDKLRRAFD